MTKLQKKLIKDQKDLVVAEARMRKSLNDFRAECKTALTSFLRESGYRGKFEVGWINFEAGIMVKGWDLMRQVYHVWANENEDQFLVAITQASPKFYKKFGIKIWYTGFDGTRVRLPNT